MEFMDTIVIYIKSKKINHFFTFYDIEYQLFSLKGVEMFLNNENA